MDRAIEVRDLAAQIIDPFGRCDRAGEDGAFDLFDVGFEVGDDRAVALDHLVQDCPEHRVSAKCKQFGVLFEPRARAVQVTRDTLSNRNDESRSDEDADLAEIDLALVMVVTGGAQDDQLHPGFVFFDLRAQVEGLGVLDGKLVQTERFPDLVEPIPAGLEHPQPYEAALMTLHGSLIEQDRAVALTATVKIVSAVDNHRGPPAEQRRTQLLATFNSGYGVQGQALRHQVGAGSPPARSASNRTVIMPGELYDDEEIVDFFYDDISNLEAEDREKITFDEWLVEMLLNGVFFQEENSDAQ